MNNIGLASDHAGFALKSTVEHYLKSRGYTVVDFGCHSDQSCDYPDYAHPLGTAIDEDKIQTGIVFCGSGNGINMTINKHRNVRSAVCWNLEIALLARRHNDANVCSLPARFISEELALEIVDHFLSEPFEGGRHIQRIQKIPYHPL